MKKTTALKKEPARKTRTKADISLTLARSICEAIDETKGNRAVVLDLKDHSSYADFLVIASGSNTRQVLAIADRIQETVHAATKKWPLGVEGTENGLWVLVDYGDVVAHVFLEETREFYRLEKLWHDAKRVKI